MIDISKAFIQGSKSVAELYQQTGQAFFIPDYQREYSWDKENIDQLMQDVFFGVENLSTNPQSEIRFLGTIIRVLESRPVANLEPKDVKGLPSKIDKVIDGQQRITTLALLGCLLYQRLAKIRYSLPKDPPYDELDDELRKRMSVAEDLFSVDVGGQPRRKPKVIRGSTDHWTRTGEDADYYTSDVASYVAAMIRSVADQKAPPPIPREGENPNVRQNLARMNVFLDRVVDPNPHSEPHDGDEVRFPRASEIIEKIPEQYIWTYGRSELKDLVLGSRDGCSKDVEPLISLVQLLAFCHYLFDRCCVTVIDIAEEEWAFDMFQSLNATGTPLTAIETFKPTVVQRANQLDQRYKGSLVETYFGEVEALFVGGKTVSNKEKLTNEYLTTFALVNSGKGDLAQRFSAQQRWLTESYKKEKDAAGRQEFIRRMSDLANYWSDIILYSGDTPYPVLEAGEFSPSEIELVALCVKYLEDAGNKLARAVLSRYYSMFRRKEKGASQSFGEAAKATAAFFTLWRAARPNTGLDDRYRALLSGDNTFGIKPLGWQGGPTSLEPAQLRSYYRNVLDELQLSTREQWLERAVQNLRFDKARAVCRFALFIAAHDTMPDDSQPGLMKPAVPGAYVPCLTYSQWRSKDLKEIEHVAPRTPASDDCWDTELYDISEPFHLVGNLTLLPKAINASASNKGWTTKWLYYQYLAEMDPNRRAKLYMTAESLGISLQPDTIKTLQEAKVNHHVRPLISLEGNSSAWSLEFVLMRSTRICELVWDRIHPWLE